jgi:hypothetical protein
MIKSEKISRWQSSKIHIGLRFNLTALCDLEGPEVVMRIIKKVKKWIRFICLDTVAPSYEHGNVSSGFTTLEEYLHKLSNFQLLKRGSAPWR